MPLIVLDGQDPHLVASRKRNRGGRELGGKIDMPAYHGSKAWGRLGIRNMTNLYASGFNKNRCWQVGHRKSTARAERIVAWFLLTILYEVAQSFPGFVIRYNDHNGAFGPRPDRDEVLAGERRLAASGNFRFDDNGRSC